MDNKMAEVFFDQATVDQLRAAVQKAGEIDYAPPDGWSKSRRNPAGLLSVFPSLGLKKSYKLCGYLFTAGGDGNGIVWALPTAVVVKRQPMASRNQQNRFPPRESSVAGAIGNGWVRSCRDNVNRLCSGAAEVTLTRNKPRKPLNIRMPREPRQFANAGKVSGSIIHPTFIIGYAPLLNHALHLRGVMTELGSTARKSQCKRLPYLFNA